MEREKKPKKKTGKNSKCEKLRKICEKNMKNTTR